jgi:UDP-glucuronate decarboxylase
MYNKIIEDDLKYIINYDLPWEQLRNKTILVTGATGFIASYIIDTLIYLNEVKNYNIKIICLSRGIARLKYKYYDNRNLIHFIYQDINDEISIKDSIGYIIHTASIATPKLFESNPVDVILPNVVGTNNLLKLAVEKKVKGFIFISTTGIYGYNSPDKYPLCENDFGYLDPTNLNSCYLESKRQGENLCIAYMHQYNVPIKIIRPSITYGYGIRLDDGRSFADFIKNILNNEDIILYSDGKVKRNFCYITDFITGFFTVMLRGISGESYNIATEDEISIIDLAKFLTDNVFLDRNLKVILNNKDNNFLRMNFSRTQTDITKMKNLRWKLIFDLKEGFKRTIKYYEEELRK